MEQNEYEMEDYYDDLDVDYEQLEFEEMREKQQVKFSTVQEVFDKLMREVKELQDLLELNEDQVFLLLNTYNWNKELVMNKYFDNPFQKEDKSIAINNTNQKCRICLEVVPQLITTGFCGHQSCRDCLQQYITYQLSQKQGGLLACTESKCSSSLAYSLCLQLMNKQEQQAFRKQLASKYTMECKSIKYCPGVDCIYVVENSGYISDEVECKCGQQFCFLCLQEWHQPASCQMLAEWNLQNLQENQNIKWIMVNTKMCPKCRNPIEKNQGCNHMTCTQCKHEFCWVCLTEWQKHITNTNNSYYNCNKYKGEPTEESIKNKQKNNRLKSQLDKYLFYYQRYKNHLDSHQQTQQLANKLSLQIQWLHSQNKLDLSQVEFINETIQLLLYSRRTLKCSYVLGYYLKQGPKIAIFEFNQAQCESFCEHLHELLEKQLFNAIKNKDMPLFFTLKQQVVNLYTCTKKFTDKFLNDSSKYN